MPSKRPSPRAGARPSLEHLEDRSLPAGFGLPWADAGRLTLSFAPDGTGLPSGSSDLLASLDAQGPRADWQYEVLRAFQAWAVHANVNFAVVPDGGQALGAPGPVQGDARFGDVRLAGQAMSREAMAVSVPHDPFLAGTWAGDVVFNTAAVGPANLFLVAAHEAAHVLGLGNSSDPNSVRFGRLGDGAALTPGDIAELQALYGARRPDAHEGQRGNDTSGTAARLRYSNDGATPAVAFGDVTTASDVDWFFLPTPDDYRGPVTFHVQSAGLSLLAPAMSVYDSAGRLLGSSSGTSPLGSTLSVRLDSAAPDARYYVRVSAATDDVFGVGRYALVATFDDRLTVPPEQITRVVQGAPSQLTPHEVDDLFKRLSDPVYGAEYRRDDSAGGERRLRSVAPVGAPGRYQAVASISPAGDVDVYELKPAPNAPRQPAALVVTVSRSALHGTLPHVELLDERGHVLPAEVLVRTADRVIVQAVGLAPDRPYHVRVSGAAGAAGNYELDAQFLARPVSQTAFVRGAVTDAAAEQTYRLFLGQSQLFQFTLASLAASLDAAGQVVMELRDDRGELVLSLEAGAGETNTASTVFLAPGAYTATFRRVGQGGLAYALRGASMSDPIGPALTDPTLAPQYQAPGDPTLFLYPGDVLLGEPFFWVLLSPTGPLLVPGPDGAPASAYPVFDGACN